MSGARAFASLNIKVETRNFTGPKIAIEYLLDREITVHYFKVEPSNYGKPGTQRVRMQITLGDAKYIVFTNSTTLKEQIEKVGNDNMPITTTIKRQADKSFLFT